MRRFLSSTLWQAQEQLATLGVTYDSIWEVRFNTKRWTQREEWVPSGMVYFMKGDCDVAYLATIINVLCVHDTPRQWHEKTLTDLREHGISLL